MTLGRFLCRIGIHKWVVTRFSYMSWYECGRCGKHDYGN